MPLPSWPLKLPQEWFDGGNPPTYTPADNTIRTQVTAGPAKLRRRFTAQTEDVKLQRELHEWEIATLKDFVKNTLGETGRFLWKDFRTGQNAQYRFKAGWSSVGTTWFGEDVWTVTMELELMP